jgi:hypothetical protein
MGAQSGAILPTDNTNQLEEFIFATNLALPGNIP